MTIAASGTTSRAPLRRKSGNQSFVDQKPRIDWTAPRARPAHVATMIEVSPPISAAARAANTKPLSSTGVIWPWIGPTKIAASVAVTEAITQFNAARNCGVEAEQHGALLVAGRAPGGQAEAGELEDGPQDQTHDDGDAHRPQRALRVGLAEAEEVVDRRARHDARRVARRAAEVHLGDALQVEHHADGGDHLAQRCGVAQRAEHDEVGEQAEQDGHQHGDEEGQRRRDPTVAEVDRHRNVDVVRRQEVHPRQLDAAVAPGLVEGEHAVHGERTGGEVDHAGAAVDDHQAAAEHGVQRAEPEPGDQVKGHILHVSAALRDEVVGRDVHVAVRSPGGDRTATGHIRTGRT